MSFLKRLFGAGPQQSDDPALHLYVRCAKCGSVLHVRVDLRNELVPDYGDNDQPSGYRLVKEMMDSRCFKLMRAELTFNARKQEISRTLEGGTFITAEEYAQSQ